MAEIITRVLLSLQLATDIASATIMHLFTPFTMSQVLLACLHDDGPTWIVKVYDPQFAKHRLAYKSRPARPWSHELEAKAISRTTPDPNFNFSLLPEGNDRVGWEIWYYQQMECCFRNEVVSYNLLCSLQGHEIPCCYGPGTLSFLTFFFSNTSQMQSVSRILWLNLSNRLSHLLRRPLIHLVCWASRTITSTQAIFFSVPALPLSICLSLILEKHTFVRMNQMRNGTRSCKRIVQSNRFWFGKVGSRESSMNVLPRLSIFPAG